MLWRRRNLRNVSQASPPKSDHYRASNGRTVSVRRSLPDSAATRIIRLEGDLRRDAAIESVRQECLQDIQHGRRRVVLDFEHVEEVDTKFIACLVCLRRMADAAGVALELHLSPRVRDWLELCQTGHLFRPAS